MQRLLIIAFLLAITGCTDPLPEEQWINTVQSAGVVLSYGNVHGGSLKNTNDFAVTAEAVLIDGNSDTTQWTEELYAGQSIRFNNSSLSSPAFRIYRDGKAIGFVSCRPSPLKILPEK